MYGDNISSIFPNRAEGRTAVEEGLFQLALYVLHWEFQFVVDYLQERIKNLPEPNEYFEDEEIGVMKK